MDSAQVSAGSQAENADESCKVDAKLLFAFQRICL
jgi:hypothetical protein